MEIYQWIIVFFLYSLFCVTIEKITGIPGIYVFLGAPVLGTVVILFSVLFVSRTPKRNSQRLNTTKAKPTSNPDIDSPPQRQKKRIEVLDTIFQKLDTGNPKISSELISIFKNPDRTPNDHCLKLERLYLSLRYKKLEEFDWLIELEFMEHYRDPKDEKVANCVRQKIVKQLTNKDLFNSVSSNCHEIFESIIDSIDLTALNFPTQLKLVDILRVPKGSFLEQQVTSKTYETSIIREEALALEKTIGKERVSRFLYEQYEERKAAIERSAQKSLSKQKVTATTVHSHIAWATDLCYSKNSEDITRAEELVSSIIDRASASTKTKKMREALEDAHDFLSKQK